MKTITQRVKSILFKRRSFWISKQIGYDKLERVETMSMEYDSTIYFVFIKKLLERKNNWQNCILKKSHWHQLHSLHSQSSNKISNIWPPLVTLLLIHTQALSVRAVSWPQWVILLITTDRCCELLFAASRCTIKCWYSTWVLSLRNIGCEIVGLVSRLV